MLRNPNTQHTNNGRDHLGLLKGPRAEQAGEYSDGQSSDRQAQVGFEILGTRDQG